MHESQGGGRDVNAVADDLEAYLREVEDGTDYARLAVVEGSHAVEDVGGGTRAGRHGGSRLIVGRVAVADRGDDAGVGQCANEVERSRQLRGERDQPPGTAAGGEQPLDGIRLGLEERGRV